MEIIVGKTAGFCYGVERAVNTATKEAIGTKQPLYCLGEIVHNKQVIQKLENLGVKCVETIDEAKNKMLIRAHGVPKEVYDLAKELHIEIQDCTCPNVLKIHKIAEEFSKNGYFIFLLGSKHHPENLGTVSYCENNCYIIENQDDIDNAINAFQQTKKTDLLLIAQTTFSVEQFNVIEQIIKEKIDKNINFVVKNTICGATEIRQKETEELAKKVDTMIIIGGKNSSNTKKLYEVAKKYCDNTFLVETANELELEKIVGKVGVMAGASTPKESIDEIIKNCIKFQV